MGLAVLLMLFAVVAGRLVQIQGLDGAAYASAAADQRLRTVQLPAERGEILDSEGQPLAYSVQARALFADPKMVKRGEPSDTAHTTAQARIAYAASRMSSVLNVPQTELVAAMSKNNRFDYLARGLDPRVAQKVVDMALPGIGTAPESNRKVPGHTLAAPVIGFVNRDGVGRAGIEAEKNSVLAGKPGSHTYEIGGQGQEIPGGVEHEVPAAPGKSVQLTIDRDVQYATQHALFDRSKQVKAYSASAIVMDAKTFQIKAMASYPTFDAASPGKAKPGARVNTAISNVIEPGSIHKAITFGAALQTGLIGGDYAPVVAPTIVKGGKTFSDTHKHGTVPITLMGILAQSSNVGTIETAAKLGAQKLYDYQRKFGLGTPTGVGLPGESGGIVQPPKNWSGPSYGGIPIGLGVAVTPLQMAAAYATIANNGLRLTPSVIAGTKDADGVFQRAPAAKKTRVLSAKNATILRGAMSAITTKQGTGEKAAIPGYLVSGKTGTGQATADNRYLPGNVSSFIGMAPFDHPRYVVAVFVHAPSGEGGAVSGPAFAEVMSYVLRHYGAAPAHATAPPLKIYGGDGSSH